MQGRLRFDYFCILPVHLQLNLRLFNLDIPSTFYGVEDIDCI